MEVYIREYISGELGLVSYKQMEIYREQYGFRPIFEYYILDAMADFCRDNEGGMLWVAEVEGEAKGAVAIVKVDSKLAKLRWFYVDPDVQGNGIGRTLMNKALEFCRGMNYEQVELWTVDELLRARRLYASFGFVHVEDVPNEEWTDHQLMEEKWLLTLK